MEYLNAVGSRQRVVMSQNRIPGFGKFGMPLMESAIDFFLDSMEAIGEKCCLAGGDRLLEQEAEVRPFNLKGNPVQIIDLCNDSAA